MFKHTLTDRLSQLFQSRTRRFLQGYSSVGVLVFLPRCERTFQNWHFAHSRGLRFNLSLTILFRLDRGDAAVVVVACSRRLSSCGSMPFLRLLLSRGTGGRDGHRRTDESLGAPSRLDANALAPPACTHARMESSTSLDDVGFQLSFVALFSLISLAPRLVSWFLWIPQTFQMRTTIVCTLAASFSTAPILLWHFVRYRFSHHL